jgi:hypothetical protein
MYQSEISADEVRLLGGVVGLEVFFRCFEMYAIASSGDMKLPEPEYLSLTFRATAFSLRDSSSLSSKDFPVGLLDRLSLDIDDRSSEFTFRKLSGEFVAMF